MFRLDNILERWASAYKPLSHVQDAKVGKGKSFFRIGKIDTNNEFNRNFNVCPHSIMAFSTLVDAKLSANGRTVDYQYTLYFMVKQVSGQSNSLANDDEQSMECLYKGNDMMIDLMAFLAELKKRCTNKDSTDHSTETNPDIVGKIAAKMTSEDMLYLSGLDLSSAEWGSIPMKYNCWWLTGMQFDIVSPKQVCVTESQYNI